MMDFKCDELIVHEPQDGPWGLFNTKTNCTVEEETCYLKSEVDAAIAELKQEIKYKEGVGKRWFDRCMEARSLWVKNTRALWLARAELCRRLDVDRYLRKHLNSWYNENYLTFNDACVAMEVKVCKAESKCRAKAEGYK